MQIEEGKFYRTREGMKVGPMRRYDLDSWYDDGAKMPYARLWRDNGERYCGDKERVITEEWKDKMTDFDPNWPHGHVTRDGRKARIICTDRKGKDYSIIALAQRASGDNEEITLSYTSEGKYHADGTDSGADLFNAPELKQEFWVNVFYCKDSQTHALSRVFDSKENAEEHAKVYAGREDFMRIACVRFAEGDGL